MTKRLALVTALAVATFSFASTSARADVPPQDSCQTAGSSCTTAPPDYKSPGICTATKCTKQIGPDGSPYEYDCNLCKPDDGGSAGSGGGSATGGASATGGSKSSSGDSGGCSIVSPGAGVAGALFALGLSLGAFVRRRRRG